MKLKTLDLFAGAGGFTVAGELAGGYETIAFCEIDKYAQKVLAKNWPDVPIFEDVTKLKGSDVGAVDVITGGFPCQDVSIAGPKTGTVMGERSSLYSEILRIATETGRPYIIMENVGHLVSGGNGYWFAAVMHGLAEIGYDAEWHVLPASYIGAVHRRERVWIIAYPSEKQLKRDKQEPIFSQRNLQGQFGRGFARWARRSDIPEPRGFRANDGFPNRAHRTALMGNAIVPQVAAYFMRALYEAHCAANHQSP